MTPILTDHTLTLGDYSEDLPRLAQACLVHIWSVPSEYRASGYFISLQLGSQPMEIPACDYRSAEKVATLELPADAEAAALAEQESQRAGATAAIAERRYQMETAGITVNGLSIDTSRNSQSLITGAALQATIDSTYTCRWKTASGFVDLSAQQILDLATAVRAHVQACFDREAELLDQLAAGTLTPDMLEQGWPQ